MIAPPAGTASPHGTLDPIAFEVIRHRLWAINDDQGRTAARLSGSPIVYEAFDFNAALLTADGESLYTGVYILEHGATIDEFVRRVLADWGREDIHEGDMFFTNDPWWGALHANDGILAMPVFYAGELVAWSGIVMHDEDVGSPVPGSFVTGARDRFGEAPLIPGIRIARGFELCRDVERAYLRHSRTPQMNALNLRARVAALRTTHQRVHELIEQYGLETVRAAQDGIVDYVERVVRGRLARIPDGSWYAQGYHDHDGATDAIYRICCRITKAGERLTFDMRGTDPQAPGAVNCARPAMEGAVLGVMLTFMCADLPWAIGGLRRVVEIVSQPGTVNDAVEPAATSMASVMCSLTTQDVVAHAFAKMLLTSERAREEAQANWAPGIAGGVLSAARPDGERSFTLLTDHRGGGGGARTFADGIDSGGLFHSVACTVTNVEVFESRSAALYLYRRELADTAGAGRFRGGLSLEVGIVPHKVDGETSLNTTASGMAMPAGRGLSGAMPGAAVSRVVLRRSNVREQFAAGRVPSSRAELTAEAVDVQAAKQLTSLAEHDVVVGVMAGGGGFGDPLRRDPERVAEDVRAGRVSAARADSLHGVVMREGRLDAAATGARRDAIRRRRLEQGSAPAAGAPTTVEGDVLHPVSDTVEAVLGDGGRSLRCSVCHFRFGAYDSDHKRAASMRELPLTVAAPQNELCRLDAFVLREFSCPGCGTAVAVDVQRRDEPILDESVLALRPGG